MQLKRHFAVKVRVLPKCDFYRGGVFGTQNPCRDNGEAHYDGHTILGTWANMCEQHYSEYGVGLGTGRGQILVADGN